MKGHKLRILIYTIIALAFGILMAAMNFYPSWSQHIRTAFTSLLIITIISIIRTYDTRSMTHARRDETAYRIFGMRITFGRADRITAVLFCGVLATPVNLEVMVWGFNIMGILHSAFTGLAILSAYRTMWAYDKRFLFWMILGLSLFAGGFIFKLYTVGWAEVGAAVPIAYYLLRTNKT